MNGIIIHTGAIDENYTGEIAVRITLPTGWQLKTWEKKVQRLLLPYIAPSQNNALCEGGFSSEDDIAVSNS